jgi:hypothetical protein
MIQQIDVTNVLFQIWSKPLDKKKSKIDNLV